MTHTKKHRDVGELYFAIFYALVVDAMLAAIWFSSEEPKTKTLLLVVLAIPIMIGLGAHIEVFGWIIWGAPELRDIKPPRYRSDGW